MTDAPDPAGQRRTLNLQRAQADLAIAQDDLALAQAVIDALAKPDVVALNALVTSRYDATVGMVSQPLNRQLGYLRPSWRARGRGCPRCATPPPAG